MGLSLSSLKVQVSAISAVTKIKWAEDPLIVQFLKAVIKIIPPRKIVFPQWDLSVLLDFLSGHPFVPTEQCLLWDITQKAVFLTTITSGPGSIR